MKIRQSLIILSMFFAIIEWHCTLPTVEDITPPIVFVLYPYTGSILAGTVSIAIESTDENEIQKVWYYIDGELIEMASTSNPRFQLNIVPRADEKVHILVASAVDKDGNVGYSAPVSVTFSRTDDVVLPVVAVVNPVGGQVVEGLVHILASADDDRLLEEVSFFIDGDSVGSDYLYPYEYIWNTESISDSTSHTIFAKAFDSSRNWSVSSIIEVTVFPRSRDVIPPNIILVYPVAGSLLNGTVNVSVDVTDDSGVNLVEFFVDGGVNGIPNYSTTSPPWIFSWNTTPWANGRTHTLFIKAYDTFGNEGVFGPASFTIQ